ncbi:dehydrodolichyl diphosphate synthase [Salix suchowensis]|nr:dehydrodolichyl diphosphate synthase [Salix suchowensis]
MIFLFCYWISCFFFFLESMPRHVAVIMDGNSRWARQRGLLTPSGHEAGLRSMKEFIKLEEVDIVMALIENLLKSVSIIGDTSRVPKSLQRTICEIQEMTRECWKIAS